MNKSISACVIIFVVFSAGSLLAGAPKPEELEKQKLFRASYKNPNKDERIKAIAVLEGTSYNVNWTLLLAAAGSDPDEEVRMAAIQTLVKCPAHDATIGKMLAQHFRSLKPKDFASHLMVAKAAVGIEYKYDFIVAMSEFIQKELHYPEVVQPSSSVEMVRKAQEQFSSFLEAYNAIADSSVKEPSARSRQEIKKWLDANSPKMLQAERELTENYRKFDLETGRK